MKLVRLFITTILLLNINPAKVIAETLSYDSVLDTAINNSYDLQIAKSNINIGKFDLKATKSAYYPTLFVGMNKEYANDLGNNSSQVSTVGDQIFPAGTKYQDAVYFGLNYNLYDFGIRKRKLLIAKDDLSIKNINYFYNLRDLNLKIVDDYTDALILYKNIKNLEKVKKIQNELLDIKQKLYENGKIYKFTLTEEQYNVAKVENDIYKLKIKLKKALTDVSFYTLKNYDVNNIEIADFNTKNIVPVSNVKKLDLKNTYENNYYQLELTKKDKDLSILKRENLPKVNLYTKYNFYGADSSNPLKTTSDLSGVNLIVGVSGRMTLFDGFNNSAERKKLQEDIKRIKLEKEKKLTEINNNYEKIHDDVMLFEQDLKNQENLISIAKDQVSIMERLNKQSAIDKIILLNQKITLINQEWEKEKININQITNLKKLEIYSKGYEKCTQAL